MISMKAETILTMKCSAVELANLIAVRHSIIKDFLSTSTMEFAAVSCGAVHQLRPISQYDAQQA